MWSKWKPHQQGACPIPAVAVFEAKMIGGETMGPLLTFEADWYCPDDPILEYRVKEVFDAQEIIRKEFA